MTSRAIVLVHCSCSRAPIVELEKPPSLQADYEYHKLADLYFCEECDAIKCSRCVTEEISIYYCPNCLFEVSTSTVRGEKNRCARNCFLCPHCENYLSVVASDPAGEQDPAHASSSVGELPYYLHCGVCRWDSKEIGLSFDKSTGLSSTVQKQDDSSPLQLSFDHIQEHLEPFVRAGMAASQPSISASAAKPLAASSSRFGSLHSLSARTKAAAAAKASASFKDELPEYEAPVPGSHSSVAKKDLARLQALRTVQSLDELTLLDHRSAKAWDPPLLVSDLRPHRVPLHAKYTKRCPDCKHILSKPDTKAISTKFRIKLIAPHYLPRIELSRRMGSSAMGPRLSAIGAATSRSRQISEKPAEEPLRSGRSYTFELRFINPLYEPIEVQLGLVEPVSTGEKPFNMALSAKEFPISAFAEQWELDEEDEALGMGAGKPKRRLLAGVLERKANRTTVSVEVAIGKEFTGALRAQMLVTYRYAVEEPIDADVMPKSDNIKSFTYWTLLSFGDVTASRLRPSGLSSPSMSRDPSNETSTAS